MSGTASEADGASSAVAERRYEPRGDLARVHREVVRALCDVATAAAYEGGTFIYEWMRATKNGQQATAADPVGPHNELLKATQCLELAMTYVRQLRDEIGRQVSESERPEPWSEPPW